MFSNGVITDIFTEQVTTPGITPWLAKQTNDIVDTPAKDRSLWPALEDFPAKSDTKLGNGVTFSGACTSITLSPRPRIPEIRAVDRAEIGTRKKVQ